MGYVPGISVSIREVTKLTASTSYSSVCVIGVADWGPVNKPVYVTSPVNVVETFKAGNLVYGGLFVFDGGATNVLLYRITDGSETYAEKTFKEATDTTAVLKIKAKYPGTYGNNISIKIEDVSGKRKIIITDGKVIERFDNSGDGYSSNDDIVAAINAKSNLVTAEKLADDLVATTSSEVYLSGGSSGTSVSTSNYEDALENLNTEDFDLLVTPEQTDDSFHTAIKTKIEARYNTHHKPTIYVAGVAEDESIDNIKSRTTFTSDGRMVLVAPGKFYDSEGRKWDGSYLACVYAGVISSLPVHISPTHKSVPVTNLYVDESKNKQNYNVLEQEILLSKGVTPITKIDNNIAVVRAVTRITDTTSPFFE